MLVYDNYDIKTASTARTMKQSLEKIQEVLDQAVEQQETAWFL